MGKSRHFSGLSCRISKNPCRVAGKIMWVDAGHRVQPRAWLVRDTQSTGMIEISRRGNGGPEWKALDQVLRAGAGRARFRPPKAFARALTLLRHSPLFLGYSRDMSHLHPCAGFSLSASSSPILGAGQEA